MTSLDRVAERFAAERPRLLGLAAQVPCSATEAEDVVQEARLRLSRGDPKASRT